MCETMQMDSKQPDWLLLDDLIMEKIFQQLSIRDRFNASLVCHRWSMCFELPNVWRNIVINDQWLLKAPNIADNFTHLNRSLDYERITCCLLRVGHHFRNVSIRPSQDFVSLYQFFVLLEWYFRNQNQINGSDSSPCNIRKLIFEFPCNQPLEEDRNGIKLFGIGGQIMSTFKKLLTRMSKLCDLILVDLVLEKYEANSLMDVISLQLNQSMKEFTAINLTVNHCPFQQVAMLSNLKVLKLSPHNIDDFMLHSIAQSNLTHFHIIQNENTPKTVVACSIKAWSTFKQLAGERLKVHLEASLSGNDDSGLLIQPEAPIHSIKCKNVGKHTVKKVIDNYSTSLVSYSEKSSDDCDNDLIELVTKCCNLTTLKLIRPITTATLLTMVAISDLRNIRVGKSYIVVKCEQWIIEFCYNNSLNTKWIQENATSIEKTEAAISKQLSGHWHFASL